VDTPIYTDHLNAVTVLNNALLKPPLPHSWSSLPARSLYRWIYSILTSSPNHPTLHHIRAHTSAPDPASLANDTADNFASSSHSLLIPPPPVPLPTFFMDRFTPYIPSFQYIDSNLPALLHSLLASRSFFNSSFTPLHTLSPFFYDCQPAPLHPYTHSSSSYSAVVQLYARSNQLPTNYSRAIRFHSGNILCRFGCQSLEDVHHLFVHCPLFDKLRDEYSQALVSDAEHILNNLTLPTTISSHLVRVITHLFRDDSSWPLHSSRFYLGLLPPLLPPTTSHKSLAPDSQRALTRLAQSCHTSAIRLTVRIWGMALRHYLEMSSTSGSRAVRTNRDALLRNSKLSLPPHLNYLLHLH